MSRPHPAVVTVVLATIALLVFNGCSSSNTGEATPQVSSTTGVAVAGKIAPTVLIIDASDSMLAGDAPGPRIDAAKKAANTLVDALPSGSELAILTYGTGTGNAPAEYDPGCKDVTEIVPLSALDPTVAHAAINALAPRGYTPIAESLRRASAVLPTNKPAAIVLISDGEDICGQPPCDVARQLKQENPDLQISTVGFKTQGQASVDLKCIADVSGGVFVTAANPAQLEARLLATQNSNAASQALNGGSLRGITLGQSLAEIRGQYNDFPAGGSRHGDQTIIVWLDCEWTFGADGTLQEINPRSGARTIDGLSIGDPIAKATELYGDPVVDDRAAGDRNLIFVTEPGSDLGYRISVDEGGAITSIVVCRCVPGVATAGVTASEVLRPFTTSGSTAPAWLKSTNTTLSGSLYCGSEDAPGVVDDGIYWCKGSAGVRAPCAPTVGSNYVMCVMDPFEKTVDLLAPSGSLPPSKPVATDPNIPFGLVLANGDRCRFTDDRAASPGDGNHGYTRVYLCDGTSTPGLVWAMNPAEPIDRTGSGWTVLVGDPATPTKVGVATAIYVGFAE